MNFEKRGKAQDVEPALQGLHDDDGQAQAEDRAEPAGRVGASEDGDENGEQQIVGTVAGRIEFTPEMMMSDATPERRPVRTYVLMRTISLLIPEKRAAWGLEPYMSMEKPCGAIRTLVEPR